MHSVIDFPYAIIRDSAPEHRSDGIVSAARAGKPDSRKIIQDNGIGISNVGDVGRVKAADILRSVFDSVREQPPDLFDDQIAATAAMAMTTQEGVGWRGAGDGIVMAIGDNGRAIVLNGFQLGVKKDEITNSLFPGDPGRGDATEAGWANWEEIEQKLGTKKIRIAVMSDGVSKSHAHFQIANDIEDLIRLNKIRFNDHNWAGSLLTAASDKLQYNHYKVDDRIVVSVQRPHIAKSYAVIGAFDGVSGGGNGSARIAHDAVEATQNRVAAMAPVLTAPIAARHTQWIADNLVVFKGVLAQFKQVAVGLVKNRKTAMFAAGGGLLLAGAGIWCGTRPGAKPADASVVVTTQTPPSTQKRPKASRQKSQKPQRVQPKKPRKPDSKKSRKTPQHKAAPR